MKIAIVDDQPVIRLALAGILRDVKPIDQLFEANDFASALGLFKDHRDLDLVLIGLSILQPNDAAALDMIRSDSPHLPIAVVATNEDPPARRRLRDRGVLDVFHKNLDSPTMRAAMAKMLGGEPCHVDGGENPEDRPKSILTARQCDVLSLLAQGMTNLGIARALGLAENTVRVHVSAILQCLNVSNRSLAVTEARRRGLIA